MKRILLIVVGVCALSACGNQSPPSVSTVQKDAQYFTLVRPDGTRMECVEFGAGTPAYIQQNSKSWFSFTCDWSGNYKGSS